ncbi:MAG TPA: cytochrome c oxidase subunit 3 family protein [Thermoanaerobaculia bacterium]|nr:cytochrome c oxidase subunit 3 family protein [Thermoanaerobaculia bacterium]
MAADARPHGGIVPSDTHAPDAHAHAGVLQHHFDSLDQQRDASTLGMWAFVAQEAMFFGGLFTAYLVYRFLYPQAFHLGSHQLNILLGGINTAVLITSSLTMAMAVWSAQTGRRKLLTSFLVLTLLLGTVFLVIKYFEYAEKFHHGLVPGYNFNQAHFPAGEGGHVQLFFCLYFAMTGMHAIHMIIGAGILLVYIPLAAKGKFTVEYAHPVELFGLYWHFVDIVWIFLFPLLYLLGRY